MFNVFLTSMGIASLVVAYFVWRGNRWSFVAASICGFCYLLVYMLDLGHIFPLSPSQMPTALLSIELIGCIVSFPLMYFSVTAYQMSMQNTITQNSQSLANRLYIVIFVIALAMLGIVIITFATRAAMGVN